jgi:hypothetical protein
MKKKSDQQFSPVEYFRKLRQGKGQVEVLGNGDVRSA